MSAMGRRTEFADDDRSYHNNDNIAFAADDDGTKRICPEDTTKTNRHKSADLLI
jgi:hypothetical protein